ncbi:uncharacterized protein LOC126888453 [Diabrotica virgifera virgifera]|uniref:Uncharacterized protein LOC114345232 n=1 Tax=Diabrotica virgifera virgifera TaxID=50390 RepID=A0A6P7GPM7_DIAVI|nr:uncharacterized protein LOC126888212 [Diabrotica virgifera virgifera]XP_050512723.1 uncharacterized protein LOC126888453 [Diabrotica virgifera virgifera]
MQVFSFISILLLFGMWSGFPQPNSVSATPLPVDWNTLQVAGCVGCFLPASTYAKFKPTPTTPRALVSATPPPIDWNTFQVTGCVGCFLPASTYATFKPISTTTKVYYFSDKIGWYV